MENNLIDFIIKASSDPRVFYFSMDISKHFSLLPFFRRRLRVFLWPDLRVRADFVC